MPLNVISKNLKIPILKTEKLENVLYVILTISYFLYQFIVIPLNAISEMMRKVFLSV